MTQIDWLKVAESLMDSAKMHIELAEEANENGEKIIAIESATVAVMFSHLSDAIMNGLRNDQ